MIQKGNYETAQNVYSIWAVTLSHLSYILSWLTLLISCYTLYLWGQLELSEKWLRGGSSQEYKAFFSRSIFSPSVELPLPHDRLAITLFVSCNLIQHIVQSVIHIFHAKLIHVSYSLIEHYNIVCF